MGSILSRFYGRPVAVASFTAPLYVGTDYECLPPYPTPSFLYIDTLVDAEENLRQVQPGAVVGFDLEWVDKPHEKLKPAAKKTKLAQEIQQLTSGSFSIDWDAAAVCLAQIATEDNKVFVINLHIMRAIPSEFIRICESREILKVAPGISNDGRALWDSFRQNLLNVASLGLFAKLVYPEHIFPQLSYAVEPGLQLIAAYTLGQYVSKKEQKSQWDAIPLPDNLKQCIICLTCGKMC
ncbi:hypothetical protein MVEN_00054200 [Mycena venus]|uniref:3'-5' exonuclease domain-containing protein n=1 Tax=Mycena venus TaxID=2733690 RepID=A0A8H6Z732_9AGAR|nr:hypothetical protein MVEN_00054200 [Mycena venus]